MELLHNNKKTMDANHQNKNHDQKDNRNCCYYRIIQKSTNQHQQQPWIANQCWHSPHRQLQNKHLVPNDYHRNHNHNGNSQTYHLCCSNPSDSLWSIMCNYNDNIHFFNHESHHTKRFFLSLSSTGYNVMSNILFLILSVVMLSVVVNADGCPHPNLIQRLNAPNGAPVNRYSSPTVSKRECDCTEQPEGGWYITCFSNSDEDTNDYSKNIHPPTSPKMSDEYEMDYRLLSMDYSAEIPISFTVTYVIGRKLTLTCINGAPAFKPALFQGFGIDAIDTFEISGCELPQTLPLSVILYRTQAHGFAMTSTSGSHSFSINTTGQADIVSPIRTLIIQSPKRVSIKQLNTLLSDLESLDRLTLFDFDLNDIDSYGIELFDNYSPAMINGFNVHHAKRVKRNEDNLTNTDDSLIEEITTIPPNVDLQPETTISPREIEKISDNNSMAAFITTSPPTQKPQPVNNTKEDTDDKIKINETTIDEMTTIADSPMTTVMPDANIVDIIQPEDIINTTATTTETANHKIQDNNSNDSINYEEDNDVNLENKPIFVLDENVLNFARILPNLRILQLRNFVKESNIPNVIFQIIKGLEKLEILELKSNSIDGIPRDALISIGHSLKQLYLYQNSIKEIDENAFNNLTQLEILDLSQNQLFHLNDYTFKPLKNLQHLKMATNQFQNLSEYLFQANAKLISLDLSQNNMLKPLPPNLLHGLPNFSSLSLSECNLTDISHDTRQFFRNIPNLSELNFKKNQISNLTMNGLFAWNPKLTKLDFSSNKIEQIGVDIFSFNSSNLFEINIDKNRIEELPEGLFQNAHNVHKLSAAYNRLSETSPKMFIFLQNLEELNLSHNRIATINTIPNRLPFGLGPNLRIVDLSYNNLSDFDSEINSISWNFYISIEELNLKNNNFSGSLSVPVDMPSAKPMLILDVSSNHFNTVNVENILTQMVIRDESQAQITRETIVRLDNNPLVCDCFLFPFVNYTRWAGHLFSKKYHDTIIRKTFFMVDDSNKVVCHEPEFLKNRQLNNIKLSDLICRIDDHRICPSECECKYRSYDQSSVINCDSRNLFQIPTELRLSQHFNLSLKETNQTINKVKGVIFQLRDNDIQTIDSLDPMIIWNNDEQYKPSFVEILLDKNNISSLDDNIISDDSSELSVLVRKLSLQNNNIEKVPMKMLQFFENAVNLRLMRNNETFTTKYSKPIKSKIYLGNNPINCHRDPAPPGSDCYLRDFKLWLSSHPTLVGDVDSIQCDKSDEDLAQRVRDANSSVTIVNMSDDLLCPMLIPPSSNATLMALSIICIVLASSLFVVSVLYYRNKQTILAFIYIHLNPIFICLSFTEEDLDEEKIYDAFVSYSSSDRDIVMELIEKLEKPHDMNEVSLILQNGLSIHEGKVDQVVPENVFKKSSTLKSTAKQDMDLENGAVGDNTYRLCIHERDWLPGNLISWNIVNSVQNSKRTILILSESFIQSIWFQVEFHTAYYQMLEDKMDRLIVIVRGELPPKDQLDKDLNFLLTTKTYLVWGEKWFWEKLYYAMPHKKRQPMKADKTEKDKLTSTITSNPKYNGSLNGRLNGINDGMLKWSHMNNSKPNAKAEAMKEYVDKTIASHFQLNSYSPNNQPSSTNNSEANKPNGMVNANATKPAPRSLRNSGTLATATPNTLKAFNNGNSTGFDNKSFIDETNT